MTSPGSPETQLGCQKNSAKIFATVSLQEVFTARRVCIARTMPWQNVRPSVHLSVCHTPVLCLNGYTCPRGRRMQGGMKK